MQASKTTRIASKGLFLRKVLEDILRQNKELKKKRKDIGCKKQSLQSEKEHMKVPGQRLCSRLNSNLVYITACSYRQWLSRKTKLRITVMFAQV